MSDPINGFANGQKKGKKRPLSTVLNCSQDQFLLGRRATPENETVMNELHVAHGNYIPGYLVSCTLSNNHHKAIT